MFLRQIYSILFLLLFCLFSSGCNKKLTPIPANGKSFEASFGTITKIDDYPLYNLEYSSDYKFDDYLQTGQIPNYSSANPAKFDNFACTCFSAFGDSNRLFGRNYDWETKSTYLLVFTDPPNGYSSVSTVDLSFFNYDHSTSPTDADNQNILRTIPYFPFDGMNEKGVAVGMNALSSANPPSDPSKVTIGELQLIRLILDYAGSTTEAISLVQQYNIRMDDPPIHYLVADSSGHSVIIEFVDGEMKIIQNTNPWQVTTNFIITGSAAPNNPPCWRYRTAWETLSADNGTLAESDAMNLLQTVSLSITRWSNVFDLKSGNIRIAMGRDYENLYKFSISQ